MNNNNDYFFSDLESDNPFFNALAKKAEEEEKQIYVLRRAVSSKIEYDYKKACALLMSGYKIILLDYGEDGRDQDVYGMYCDDFLEDLGYLAGKFEYRDVVGRPRDWKDMYARAKSSEFELGTLCFEEYRLESGMATRKGDLLISLLTGSINDIRRVGAGLPTCILDKVKQKIVLYDGIQSSFVYTRPSQEKVVTIQGLAGTGKTELLLHKLKEIYVSEKESKIVFACYNRVLANDMRARIPAFFNFMKVEEQILWEERLWVMRGWGSGSDQNEGVYGYICARYDIPFFRFSYSVSFDSLCAEAINQLKRSKDFKPCFDYMFIDESQDFGANFFSLCEMVTEKQIIKAGDVFQNIFDMDKKDLPANVDFLLSRCYRTAPQTLMFAHAVGMALYETPKLRWLDDDEWKACGYKVEKTNTVYKLSRHPLRRFEDIPLDTETIVVKASAEENLVGNIIASIVKMKDNNPTVGPEDIAIIFLEPNMSNNITITNMLSEAIFERFNWEVNLVHATRERQKGKMLISNRNHIKGLEFPFVICVARSHIGRNLQQRNAIYMVLTRSFISSVFIISEVDNSDFISVYKRAAEEISLKGYMLINEPSAEEQQAMVTDTSFSVSRIPQTRDEAIDQAVVNYGLTGEERKAVECLLSCWIPSMRDIGFKIEEAVSYVRSGK